VAVNSEVKISPGCGGRGSFQKIFLIIRLKELRKSTTTVPAGW